MTFRTRLAAAAAASIVLAGLAGCTAPAPEPAVDPGPVDVPATAEPGGDIDTAYLDQVVAGNRSSTAALIAQWEGEDCTVEAAVDGGTMCSTYLSTGALTIQTYEAILADYRPGAGGDLDQVFAAVDDSKAAATEWIDAECNWETTDDCATAGQAIIAGVYALEEALAAWESAA
jgi:hypothetical protein